MPQRAPGPLLAAALLTLGSLAIGACAGDDNDDRSAPPPRSAGTMTTTNAAEESTVVGGSQLVAQSTSQVEVWDAPDEDDGRSHVLSASTEPSGTLTFLVLEELDDGWLRLMLPSSSPGAVGFVRRDAVSLNRHRYRVEVSRTMHTLRVLVGDVEVVNAPVSVGPDAPPGGTNTYIKELLIPPDGSPYGGHVYGLAGWTSTEPQYGVGAGVVAIHASTSPTSLGHDTPMGAIGTDQQTLTRLVENIGLPLGTPVTILP